MNKLILRHWIRFKGLTPYKEIIFKMCHNYVMKNLKTMGATDFTKVSTSSRGLRNGVFNGKKHFFSFHGLLFNLITTSNFYGPVTFISRKDYHNKKFLEVKLEDRELGRLLEEIATEGYEKYIDYIVTLKKTKKVLEKYLKWRKI